MPEPTHPARMVADEVRKKLPILASEVARRMGGRPMDAEPVSASEAARLWRVSNPQADPMQVQMLVQAGKMSEALDLQWPWRNKLIGPGSPTKRAERAEALARQAMAAAETDEPAAMEVLNP